MYKSLNLESLGIVARPSEQIELTLSNGFKGVDLNMVDFAQQVELRGLDHARRLIDSARLKLGCFNLAVDLDAEEPQFQAESQRASQQAQLAAHIGCARCQVKLPPANDIRPYHESFELYRRRLGELAVVLQTSGVRLGVGFVATANERDHRAFQSIHTFDALLMLVKSVGVSNVGVYLDLWHWHVSGGDLAHIRALTASDVVCVVLSDATSDAGDDRVEVSSRLLPGQASEGGKIDSVAMLVLLAEAGYDGPVTPVAHPKTLDGLKREQIVEKASQSLDEVWAAAGLSRHGKLVPSP